MEGDPATSGVLWTGVWPQSLPGPHKIRHSCPQANSVWSNLSPQQHLSPDPHPHTDAIYIDSTLQILKPPRESLRLSQEESGANLLTLVRTLILDTALPGVRFLLLTGHETCAQKLSNYICLSGEPLRVPGSVEGSRRVSKQLAVVTNVQFQHLPRPSSL